jgi:hypothetical protein
MKPLVAALMSLALLACGSSSGGASSNGANADGGLSFATGDSGANTIPPNCVNLQCKQHNRGTRISGIVYDPKGTVPLYNVFVYVPNAPLDPITTGPVCTPCQAPASGQPITTATTDETGTFLLPNVPDGDDIPLVLQIGKWRRRITLPHVEIGQLNTFNTKLDVHDTTSESLVRLPKRQAEGSPDDNIPLIAVTTGACDYGECFLLNTIGIDAKEFDVGGRVHIYDGVGGETAYPHGYGNSLADLFETPTTLMQYDTVFVSCECSTYDRGSGYANVQQYLNSGGRFFGTHYAYNFFANQTQCAAGGADTTCNGPADFNGVAQWKGDDGSTFYAPPYLIDQSFPKGQSFATWLEDLQGGTPGQIELNDTRGDVDMLTPSQATRWIYTQMPQANGATTYSTVYMSFNTPVAQPEGQQCGRAVFSDVHVAGLSTGFCATADPAYSPNLNALEFLFFDLSSCVQDDSKKPISPPY